ncbi:MAG: IS110 family transposase [Cytophagales bacterium]|nr:IS110 family transposase [Cytophagales bacterium]
MCPNTSIVTELKDIDFEFFIGIDVSKSTLDFAVRNRNAPLFHLQVSNTIKGLKEFVKKCKQKSISIKDSLICMEHTGIYNALSLEFFHHKGNTLWLENAVQIKRSLGLTRGKNDKVDAIRISEYAFRFEDKLRLWSPPRPQLIKIKYLTTLRRRFMDAKNQLKTPLNEGKGFVDKQLQRQLEKLNKKPIETIQKQIKEVESEIRALIKSDSYLSGLFELVTSVDGVGEVVFWEILTTTNEFKSISDPRKLSGNAPLENDSLFSSIFAR